MKVAQIQLAASSAWLCAGYLAHGTATDYLYEKLGVPLSFTWEIYGDAAAHFNDCFRMFNPTDPVRYEEVSRLCLHMCIVYACTGAREWSRPGCTLWAGQIRALLAAAVSWVMYKPVNIG